MDTEKGKLIQIEQLQASPAAAPLQLYCARKATKSAAMCIC